MKIKVNLQIYKSKEKALFHIPIIYEKQLQKYLHKDLIVKCLDCKPPIKFKARIRIINRKGNFNYSIWIQKTFIPKIVKSPSEEHHNLDISIF